MAFLVPFIPAIVAVGATVAIAALTRPDAPDLSGFQTPTPPGQTELDRAGEAEAERERRRIARFRGTREKTIRTSKRGLLNVEEISSPTLLSGI